MIDLAAEAIDFEKCKPIFSRFSEVHIYIFCHLSRTA